MKTAIGTIVLGLVIAAVLRVRDAYSKVDTDVIETPVPVSHIVALVHGTWPRGVLGLSREIPWYRPESRIVRSLSSQPGTMILRFRWSGANSIVHRMRATESLVSRLTDLSRLHPRATFGLIAHSHGGNIALMALQDKTIGSKTAAIVALSTPFLRVSPRRGNYDLRLRFVAIATVVAMGALIVGADLLLFRFVVPGRQSTVANIAAIVVTVLAVCTSLGVSLALFVSKRTPLWGLAKAGGLIERLRVALPDPKRLLIVRPVADEATLALALGQAWSWWAQSVERVGMWLLASVVLGLSGVYAMGKLRPELLRDAYIRFPMILLGGLVACLVLAECVRVLAYVPFGFRPIIATLHLDVSVEAAPIGVSQILQAAPTQATGLNHSATWQTWQLVDQAIAWLRERFENVHADV